VLGSEKNDIIFGCKRILEAKTRPAGGQDHRILSSRCPLGQGQFSRTQDSDWGVLGAVPSAAV